MEKETLEKMIEPVVEKLGYELVRTMMSGKTKLTLQVMIDIKDESRGVTVDDCAKVSRALSKALDEADPIENEYVLEVSSPGIDRPLTKPRHFARFKGYELRLEAIQPVQDRKRIKGTLLDIDEQNNVHVKMNDEEYVVAFDNIAKAKLVLTDELIDSYENQNNLND